jgi:DNA-binding Lrp family transcriptional regulator
MEIRDVESVLQAALNLNPPPSLRQVSRDSGYEWRSLKKCSELCELIKRRREEHKAKIRKMQQETKACKNPVHKRDIQKELVSSLNAEIPEPLEHVAKRVGRSSKTLRYHFPDLCKQIVSRYKAYCTEHKRLQRGSLRNQLEYYLDYDAPAISVEEIACRFNVNPRQYYKYFPELAHRVTKRYELFRFKACAGDYLLRSKKSRKPRKIDYGIVQNILQAALTVDPPPSLTQIGRDSGYSTRTLNRFPELCNRIKRRYNEYQRYRRTSKIQEDCSLIRDVVAQLRKENLCPTAKRVIERTRPGIFNAKECREAWLRAVHEQPSMPDYKLNV